MTRPTPDVASKSRLWLPLLVIAVVLSIMGWLIGRPPNRSAEIEVCRTKYAQARTHADTIRVDNQGFGGGGRSGDTRRLCVDYRFTGMR